MSPCAKVLVIFAILACLACLAITIGRMIRAYLELGRTCAKMFCTPEVCLGIGALLAGVLLPSAAIVNDSYTELTGQLSTWVTVDSSIAEKPSNKCLSFIVSIQNPSNNPVSIERVSIELADGETIDLSDVSPASSDSPAYFRNARMMGQPVGAHEAIRISLSLDESDSAKLIGSKLVACYAIDTMGKEYGLDIKPIKSAAKDSVVNEFSLALSE